MKLRHLLIAGLALTAAPFFALDARADDAPAPAQTPQSPPQNPPKAVPGWLVDIMPYVKEGKAFRLLSISVPSAEVSFGLHNAVRNLPQNVWHRGTAQLNIYKAGDYGFSIHFDASPDNFGVNKCFAVMSIGGKPLFEFPDIEMRNKIYEVNGNVALEEGNYDLVYKIGCGYADSPETFQKAGWYSVQILGPDDNLPRFFKPDELFTVKAK